MKIKTLDVQVKEWFDSRFGNSYFAGTVTVNFNLEDEKEIILPYQSGYGDYYQYAAFKALQDENIIPKQAQGLPAWQYYQDKNVVVSYSKLENRTERELKEITADESN